MAAAEPDLQLRPVFTPGFLRVAGACAVLSALTTFGLWLLPEIAGPGVRIDGVVVQADPAQQLRLWVNYLHIFLCIAGYIAAAGLFWARRPGLAATGLAAFLLWGMVELIGVSVLIFALNGVWRPAFAAAADPAARAALKSTMDAWAAIWDALFFLLLTGFLLGTSLFGAAALAGRGLERVVGVLFLLAAPLTLLIMLEGYAGLALFGPAVAIVYPILQPISRALLGAWLWRSAG